MSSSSSSNSAHEQTLEARDLRLERVTVFADRAELKRAFSVALQKGLNNITVDNVCASIEQDSIRIDGNTRKNEGAVIIHEVQFKSEHATDAEVDTPQVRELAKQLEDLKLQKASVEDLVKIYANRLKSMDNVAEKLGEVAISRKTTDELLRFDADTELTLEKFYGYQERKAVELSARIRKSNLEVHELDQQIEKLRERLNRLRYDRPVKRSICIALEALADDTRADLELTYQAYNASWTPSYDIRVNTLEKQAKLKLSYFGNIRQETGEDWNDVNLVLSTAQPRSGGHLPKIGTLQAQLYKPPPPQVQYAAQPRMMHKAALFGSTASADTASVEMMRAAPAAAALQTATFQAESHVLSTTFTVPQEKTIPSDGSEHKVTIATLEMHPILHFDVVPSKNTNVYLTASMLNSSPYPLLAGSASVYVDNSFSAKIALKSVASGEKFDCSLGVDPTIKVHYKPVHKYQQQTGMLTKSSITMHEQKIVIKNTKREEPIILTLVEHVPKSTDEKIKVRLYAPELKSNAVPTNQPAAPTTNDELTKLRAPEAGARMNDAHNLEWTVVLNPAEERELTVRYGVEYPPTETIEYVERFESGFL